VGIETDNLDLRAKAANTLERVRAGMESQQQIPLVSQLVRLIKEISGKAEKMSIDDLVEAVSAEPTTLARVMSVASMMAYNPGGGEISSLHQAVLAIGFEQVRHLAISILLLENAQSEFTAEANRELAGTALVSGLIAAEMGRRFLTIDPDLAFVCGALRSYGRMLMATFMAEEYSSLLKRSKESPSDEVFQSVFGLTPVELGHEILAGQQLPKVILDSLVDSSQETRKQVSQNPTAALISAAEFGLRMAGILQNPELTNDNFVDLVETLSRQYGGSLPLTEAPIKELLARISLTLSSFSSHCGLSLESVVLFRRLDCLAHSRPIPPPFKATGKTSAPLPAPVAKASENENQERDEPTLQAAKSLGICLDAVTHLVREPHPDLRRIFELLVQALHRTLDLSNCLIFLKHRQSGLFRVTRGIGPLMKFAHDTVALDPEIPNVFSEAIVQGRDFFIRDPNEPSQRTSIPEWLCPADQSVPILLLPIKTPSGTFALLCATCARPAAFEMAEKLRPELLLLRNQVAMVGDFLA
jgi:HD-like signal output (HDOD) protein